MAALITRKGILTFDKQITGVPNVGGSNQSPVPMGLFQQCVGVGWPSGFFIFAGTSSANPDSGVERATIAVSKDGVTWTSTTFSDAAALCGICGPVGKDVVMIAGGHYQQSFPNGAGGSTFVMFPQFYVSTDKGKSWSILRPGWDTDVNFTAGDGNTFTAGTVTGIGYLPDSQTFYAVIQKQTAISAGAAGGTFKGDQLFYSGGAGGFSQTDSQSLFNVDSGGGSTPFNVVQAPWPSGALVNDCPFATDENSNYLYATAPNQSVHYVAVNVSPQHQSGGPNGNATVDMSTDNTLSSTVGGTSVRAFSGSLSRNFLAYVDTSGTVQTVPIDPATTTGEAGPSCNLSLDSASPMYTVIAGDLSSAFASNTEYASVSFSGAGGSNPT